MNNNNDNIRGSFPTSIHDVKINNDMNNRSHGPHHDIIQRIPDGTDQVRINNNGSVIGGTTNIGKKKIDW